jgi:flavin-dependent dehydrogenase
MNSTNCRVIVIGSGPAGSVCAAQLAGKGHSVLLVEREVFPRFHVGESLVSATQDIWERLGFADILQRSEHTFKPGAEFRLPLNPDSRRFFATRNAFFNVPRRELGSRPFAYQVDRALFDKQLQDLAVSRGAELWSDTVVSRVLFEGERAIGIECHRAGGAKQQVFADFVVDASGRRCLVGHQLGLIEDDSVIKTAAVFGYFRGVTREPEFLHGAITIYFLEHGWLWFIPLAGDVMSVGLVQNEPMNRLWGNDREQTLLAAINRFRMIQERFVNAHQLGSVRGMRCSAYHARRTAGDGWVLVGDAAFFVDPLFSSGVHVAHATAEKAAEAIDGFLRNDRDRSYLESLERSNRRYQRDLFAALRMMYRLMRDYGTVLAFITFTGLGFRYRRNPIFQRIGAWVAGHHLRYPWVMRPLIWSGNALALCAPLFAIRGYRAWQDYAATTFPGPPLQIPREPTLAAARLQGQSPPPT